MKKIAIYPGSFEYFTIFNLNILEKAEKIFGKENVIISIGVNKNNLSIDTQKIIIGYDKSDVDDIMDRTGQTRCNRIKNFLPSKNLEYYSGFLTDYVFEKEKEGYDVTIIRGLKSSYNMDVEYNKTRFMWDLKPDLKIVYIPCDPIYAHVSSRAYKELEDSKPGAGHQYLARENN